MRRSRPALAAWGAAVLLALLGAGCGSGDTSGGGTTKNGDKADDKKVVVVTYDSFALPDKAAAEFERRTGASIEVVSSGDSGAMLAGALLTAGSPDGDVIFGIDNTTAAEVASEPLLEDFTPDDAVGLPTEVTLPGRLGEALTPVDTSEVCVNVDTAALAKKGLTPPESLDDLADPRYKGLLVLESPVNSSPGMAFMLGTAQRYPGKGFEDYWRRLSANDVRIASSWDDAYYNDYSVNGGDRPMVLSYASSPPAEVVFSDGAREEPASTVMEKSCVTQVEYAGVLKGARHRTLARELVAYMLEPQWQEALPLSNFVYPVTDVTLPAEFTRWAPRPSDPIVLDPAEVSKSRDDLVERWRSIMQ